MRIMAIILLCVCVSACNTLGQGSTQFDRRDPQRGRVVQTSGTHGLMVSVSSPVMLRIIKEDKTLQMWRQGATGWTMVRSYGICRYAGELGPKQKVADLQAPEGFYEITRRSLNPMSREYLSINTGYPNHFDRHHRRTGSDVMIHGGCKSAGCFAMTDGSIEEIYAAVRDALDGGQRSIQLQIYPFEMTDKRMAGFAKSPNLDFWRQLKVGWDWFEIHQRPIPISATKGRYVISRAR